ncbi:MAG: hypothetical protein GY811_15590, partial [Myxococcales bacterium]|nr:hypothetical protein [Myxococcales bacterium]
ISIAGQELLTRDKVSLRITLSGELRSVANSRLLIEALKDIAERIEAVRVVVGAEGIGKLLHGELLADQLS